MSAVGRPDWKLMEETMKAAAFGSKELMQEYMRQISGKAKTEELIDLYVADKALKEHILQTEAAFPGYGIQVDEMVAEGEIVAVRGVFFGTHKGWFAGVPPTGKQVRQAVMIFYRVQDGRITKFWMQLDPTAMMAQLSA